MKKLGITTSLMKKLLPEPGRMVYSIDVMLTNRDKNMFLNSKCEFLISNFLFLNKFIYLCALIYSFWLMV